MVAKLALVLAVLVVASPLTEACFTDFGPVPGFYESGNRRYVAIEHNAHVSQANFPELIEAAACLTSITSCTYETGTYGLRLAGGHDSAGYRNNDQPHACLNDLTGTNNFYQRTTNGYTYIFATSDAAMRGINTAAATPAAPVGNCDACCDAGSPSTPVAPQGCPNGGNCKCITTNGVEGDDNVDYVLGTMSLSVCQAHCAGRADCQGFNYATNNMWGDRIDSCEVWTSTPVSVPCHALPGGIRSCYSGSQCWAPPGSVVNVAA
jgi:hypothetical protein